MRSPSSPLLEVSINRIFLLTVPERKPRTSTRLWRVAFPLRKREQWVTNGNEIPSLTHTGRVGLAIRRLASLLAGRLVEAPIVFLGDAGEGAARETSKKS